MSIQKMILTTLAVFTILGARGAEGSGAFSLAACQEMALQHNRTLQNARIDIEMAERDAHEAFTKYFPTVSVNAMGFIGADELVRTTLDLVPFIQDAALAVMETPFGQHLLEEGAGQLLAGMPETKRVEMLRKGYMVNATVMQPLFAGGQIYNGNRLAALQREVRRLQYAMTEKDIAQSVAEYYWQIVALRTNLTTFDAVDAQLEGVHTLTTNLYEAGVSNRNDVLTVELKQQEMASSRLKVDNAITLLRFVLAQLCGADVETFDIAPTTETVEAPDHYFVSPSEAVLGREEMALAAHNVEAKALQVKMERGKLLPTLAVGAAAFHQGFDMGDMFTHRDDGPRRKAQVNLVGLATMSIPVTDWWGGHHSIQKARLAQQRAENDRQEAQELLQIDILSAWNNLTEAFSQIAIARKSVEAATENLRLARDQYAAGTTPVSELLDAVTLFTKADGDLASALATYHIRVGEYQRKTR